MLFLPAVADSRILQKSSPVLSSYGGVGSNQIIGGQMVNRIFVTDNHAIVVILGPPKIEWANTHPVHTPPTSLSLLGCCTNDMSCLDESSVVIPFVVSQRFTDEMGASINFVVVRFVCLN